MNQWEEEEQIIRAMCVAMSRAEGRDPHEPSRDLLLTDTWGEYKKRARTIRAAILAMREAENEIKDNIDNACSALAKGNYWGQP